MQRGGWIKMHRQALHNGWLQNHGLWAFWSYCLMKASHKPTTVMVGYQRVDLEAGQFVFGRQQAAADLAMTERQVRTCLTRLISTNNLTVKATNKFSVITVVNWHSYQDTATENDQENDHQLVQEVTSKRPASDHKQEWEEEKEPKKVKKKPSPSSPEALRLSGLLGDLVLLNNPGNASLSAKKRVATVERWSVDIDKIMRIDGRTPDEVEAVIRWSQSNGFWRTATLSGAALRKQFDQLTVKMNSGKHTPIATKGVSDDFKKRFLAGD